MIRRYCEGSIGRWLLRRSLALALTLPAPLVGEAQSRPTGAPEARVGSRVRVDVARDTTALTAIAGRRTGLMLGADAHTLLIFSDGDTLAIPRARVRGLAVYAGEGPDASRITQDAFAGAAIGALAGAVIGVAVTPSLCRGTTGGTCRRQWPVVATMYAAAGSLAGVVTGGVVGASRSTERWVGVPLPHVATKAVTLSPGQLGVSLRF